MAIKTAGKVHMDGTAWARSVALTHALGEPRQAFGGGLSDIQLDGVLADLGTYAKILNGLAGQEVDALLQQDLLDLMHGTTFKRLLDGGWGKNIAAMEPYCSGFRDLVANELKLHTNLASWEGPVWAIRFIGQTHSGPESLGYWLIEALGPRILSDTLCKMLTPWRLEKGAAMGMMMEDEATQKDILHAWARTADYFEGQGNEKEIGQLAIALAAINRLPLLEDAAKSLKNEGSVSVACWSGHNLLNDKTKHVILCTCQTVPTTWPIRCRAR